MPDNLKHKGPPDSTRVNISEEWEIAYWTKKFKCTEEELQKAVKAVGSSAEAVSGYLKK